MVCRLIGYWKTWKPLERFVRMALDAYPYPSIDAKNRSSAKFGGISGLHAAHSDPVRTLQTRPRRNLAAIPVATPLWIK